MPAGKRINVIFHGSDGDLAFLGMQMPYLGALARVGSADFTISGNRPKGAATAVVGSTEIYLPIDDLLDLDEERARLRKEIAKVSEEITRTQKKLSNPEFVNKAKPEIIQKERDKAIQHEEKLRTLKASIERIQEI